MNTLPVFALFFLYGVLLAYAMYERGRRMEVERECEELRQALEQGQHKGKVDYLLLQQQQSQLPHSDCE